MSQLVTKPIRDEIKCLQDKQKSYGILITGQDSNRIKNEITILEKAIKLIEDAQDINLGFQVAHIASYSNHKTIDKIRKCLINAPFQQSDSKEVWDGKVFEVRLSGGPVATLAELYAFSVLNVMIIAIDGRIKVHCENGIWKEVKD